MITINKGLEPVQWTERKATPGFVYEAIPELRDALLEEQGYICAYCMRRIPVKDINVDTASKIEHIKSQEERDDLKLIYANMAICCPGNLNNEPHCDKLKGGNSVSFNLHTQALKQSIGYNSKDGNIKSSNAGWNDEMNRLLNLNHPLLKMNRRDKLAGVVAALNSINWNPAFIKRKHREWSRRDGEGKMNEFCGIVIWYLEKKLRQYP